MPNLSTWNRLGGWLRIRPKITHKPGNGVVRARLVISPTIPRLARPDLRGANLHGAQMVKAHLHGADLQCANLAEADLDEVDAAQAEFGFANMSDDNWPGTGMDDFVSKNHSIRISNKSWEEWRAHQFDGGFLLQVMGDSFPAGAPSEVAKVQSLCTGQRGTFADFPGSNGFQVSVPPSASSPAPPPASSKGAPGLPACLGRWIAHGEHEAAGRSSLTPPGVERRTAAGR
jgi:hypothetical protein